jgi:hypothetical protein
VNALEPTSPTLLARIGGVTAPVDRRLYAVTGCGLMAVKYAGDASLYALAGGGLLHPLRFLAPAATVRLGPVFDSGAPWLYAMVVWALPFLWIGASMSIRRARDAGLGAFVGLLFFVPFVNLLTMLGLCLLPSRSAASPGPAPLVGAERAVWAAVIGSVASGSALGLAMTVFSVQVVAAYGPALFLGAPFAMGMLTAWLFNLGQPRGALATAGVVGLGLGVTGAMLLLFALEGVFCVAMAAPLAAVVAGMGAAVGVALARIQSPRPVALGIAVLPVLTVLEPRPAAPHAVTTTIDVDASPAEVWEEVIGFDEIEAPLPWFFTAGIAAPQRAFLDGTGVGAVRHCIFTTGEFIEPITAWDPPNRLAFDVAGQPPSMRELSPWSRVFAPHVQTGMISEHGEFLLESLPEGGTRLSGTTWYRMQLGPEGYWIWWTDRIVHAIHHRVLDQVAADAERRHRAVGGETVPAGRALQ